MAAITSVVISRLARLSSNKLDSPYTRIISVSQEFKCEIVWLVLPKKLEGVKIQSRLTQLSFATAEELRRTTLCVRESGE